MDSVFEALVQRYSVAVLRTARRLLDADSAVAVHHEVFLELWRQWHSCRRWPVHWPGALTQRTLEAALERIRRSPGWPDDPPEADTDPAVARDRRLVWALARLPHVQAQVLLMTTWEGFTETQVAETLHETVEAVRGHCQRGLRTLTELLRAHLAEEDD